MRRSLAIFVSLALLFLAGAFLSAPGGAAELPFEASVTHNARSLQPGEVVLLTLQSPQALESAQALFQQREVSLFQVDSTGEWRGLIGLDLDVPAGALPVTFYLTASDGQSLPGTHSLQVRSKSFPTRRLTVEEKYVEPPEDVLVRITEEAGTLAGIFRTASPERFWQGPFERPVQGEATSSFGARSILNGRPRSPHSGTDFRVRSGTPVQAPNAGRVVLAADLYFSGNSVVIDHGLGLYSFFAHLSGFTVKEGDIVSKGNLVGYVGATGRVTGPHLHWSIRLNDARVDPLSLLALPLDEPAGP